MTSIDEVLIPGEENSNAEDILNKKPERKYSLKEMQTQLW